MAKEAEHNEADVIEATATTSTVDVAKDDNSSSEVFSRIFYTLLFFVVGWFTLWVFSFVVLIQFGFLLITSQVNTNLKGFNKEVGMFLFDLIKYLSFQTNEKPFPFRDWPYDVNAKNKNNSELNDADAVKVTK